MAGTNYIGTMTVAAGATVDMFAETSITAAPGTFHFSGIANSNGGLYQVGSGTPATNAPSFALTSGTAYQSGSASFYVQNTSASSITVLVKFVSTS